MYAQLFYKSEEGNFYPQTERVFIDDSLEGLLSIPPKHDGNNAFWEYYEQSQRQADLSGGWHLVDNNIF
jgi:hypothetical protein